jgi:hypothetical protein
MKNWIMIVTMKKEKKEGKDNNRIYIFCTYFRWRVGGVNDWIEFTHSLLVFR